MPKDYTEALPAHTSTNDPSPAKRRRITLFDKRPSFFEGAEHLFDDDEDLCPPSPSRTSPVKPRIPGPMKKPVSSVAAGPSRVAARGPFALSTKGPFRKPLFAKPARRPPLSSPAMIDLDETPTPSPVQIDPLDLASPIKLGSPDITSPTKDDVPDTSSSPYLGRGSTPVTDWDSSPPRGKKAHDSSPPSSALRNAPSSPLLPCSQQYAEEIIAEENDEEEAEYYDPDEPEFGDEPSSPLAHRGSLDREEEQDLGDERKASSIDVLRETLDPHAQVHGRDSHNGRWQVYIETPLPPPSFPLPYQPSYPLSDDEVEEEDLLDAYEAVSLSPSPTGKKRKRILSGRERGIATEPRRGVKKPLFMTPGEVATQASTMFSQASTSRAGSSRASSSRSPSRSTPLTDDYSSHRRCSTPSSLDDTCPSRPRTVDRLRSSDIDHPAILDSPTNPFGRTLKRALPDPTPYGKHITVRMRWVEPGYVPPPKRSDSASEDDASRRPIALHPRGHTRGGAVRSRLATFASGRQARVRGDANNSQDVLGAFRIVQVPLSYTFRHLTCLVKWLFEGEDGDDDGEWHVYTSIDGCTPSEARGVIRKPESVEWVRVALGKGGPFERSAPRPDMGTSGTEDDDDPFIDRSPVHLASEGENTEDDEDEDSPTFEDPDGFLLGNVWMTDGKRISLDRGLVFTTGSPADQPAEVHVTIHAGRAPEERKGKSNLPFVFGAKGRTRWSTGKIRSLDMCDSKFSDGTRFVEAWSRAQEKRHREQGDDSDDDDEGYITRSDGDMVGQAVTDDEEDNEVPFRASSRSSEVYDVGGTWSSPLKKGGSFSSPGCRDTLSSPVRAPAKRILHRTMHGAATPMPHPTFRKPLAYFKRKMEKSSREIEERARAKAKRRRLREITAARKKAQEQRAKEREISVGI